MNESRSTEEQATFATLRKFVRRKPPLERCELCGAGLASWHDHLTEPATRRLLCACNACVVLFGSRGETKYRRVPRRTRRLRDFNLTEAQWESLMIPINLAFFFNDSAAGRVVVFYPSPAGATESLLELDSWNEIAEANPPVTEMEPDVEALLVNRVGGSGQYYIAPIDECYRLVGLIRTHWRGLSGGARVWEEIATFFHDLDQRSR